MRDGWNTSPRSSERAFRGFVAAAHNVVGKDHVFLDPEWDLTAYHDQYETTPGAVHQASAAVAPADVEQVRAVLRAATQHGVPVWTISTGKNFTYGGPAPRVAGTVVLDLKRMNRIIEVNEKHAYAVVEPGVSYFDLYRHLQKIGSKLWIDPAAPGWGGVLGNLVDHGAGYTPYGDHLLMQCGMEVMHADGSLLRTGMGALPGENSWQLFKYGFGPYADGSFTQTPHAVMTKVGFWISPEPPVYRPFAWRIDSDDVFVKAMETVRSLRINMIVPNTLVAVDGESEQALTGGSDASAWNIYGALYGLPKNVDTLWKMIGGLASQLGGVTVQVLDGADAQGSGVERAALMSGRPSPVYKTFLDTTKGRALRLSFVLPIEGDIALDFVRRTLKAAQGSGCRIVLEQGTAWRSLLAEVFILFDEGGVEAALRLGRRLIDDGAKQGLGVVRASPALQPAALDRYSNAGFVKLRSQLATALA